MDGVGMLPPLFPIMIQEQGLNSKRKLAKDKSVVSKLPVIINSELKTERDEKERIAVEEKRKENHAKLQEEKKKEEEEKQKEKEKAAADMATDAAKASSETVTMDVDESK